MYFKYIWVTRVMCGQVLGSKSIYKVFRQLKTANWRLRNWNVEFSCLKNFGITQQKENAVSKVSHSNNWIRSRAEVHATQNVESVKITPISIPVGYFRITREGNSRFCRKTHPGSPWQGHGRHLGPGFLADETCHVLNGSFKTSYSLGGSKIVL